MYCFVLLVCWPSASFLLKLMKTFLYFLGFAAGFFQSFVCGPLELIKIRMQMQNIGEESQSLFSDVKKKVRLSPLSCAVNIWRNEGLVGLCRGLGSTFFREVPSFGVYFGAYDTFCKMELKEGQRIDEVIIRGFNWDYLY